MFINVSNHPSSKWSSEQLEAAQIYGNIIDIKFPNVAPEWNHHDVTQLATSVANDVLATIESADDNTHNTMVMVQGDFTLTFALVTILRECKVSVVAATTERMCSETILPDGSSKREYIFKFVQFREYR